MLVAVPRSPLGCRWSSRGGSMSSPMTIKSTKRVDRLLDFSSGRVRDISIVEDDPSYGRIPTRARARSTARA